MIPTLITFLTRLFALIGGLARFLRGGRTLPTPAMDSPPPPVVAPSVFSEIEARLEAQIAEFDQWEREYNRGQRAYRKLLRDQARARGELPPAKPRKPRQPQQKTQPKSPPKTQPESPPQATPVAPPAGTAATNFNPLPQPHFKARPAAPPAISSLSIPSLPTPSQATPSKATTPPRTLFTTLSTILIAPLRILKTALLALPRLCMRLLTRRRPPSSGPPLAQPPMRTLSNRAA